MRHLLAVSIPALVLAACGEAEDRPPEGVAVAQAFAETSAVASADDAADDPAIWLHPGDLAQSRILGTDKQAGLYVYDLSGAVLQFLESGRLNNVDVRQGVSLDGFNGDVAAASNRSDNSVTVFSIDAATGETAEIGRIPTGKDEPYGFCLGYDGARLHAFVPYKDGVVQRWLISGVGADGAIQAEAGQGWVFETQLEGCAVDEASGTIFIGEEMRGVWTAPLAGGEPALIDEIGSETGLTGDVEGVAVYRGEGGEYLVVSSQGSSTFHLYDLAPPHAFAGRFAVSYGEDGITGTDGIDASGALVTPEHPQGVLIVQDDVNSHPDAPQNYKFIDWRAVMDAALTPDSAAGE